MHPLPTGTVTLLFTDIEGSTHLLQQLGERYAELLREYRQLLRRVFEEYHGQEVDTQGDAYFVAFARATDAVAAAVAVQRGLAAHSWPQGVMVRVRIGLHTGEPELAPTGYVGIDVHHAVRIMSAGHGGQVVLSHTTRELVERNLPEGVQLRDLGAHRLKDLGRPERLFQLVIAGLPADFPPLKTLDRSPNNLPVEPTPFIGREREVAKVAALLRREEVRLLTLTGPAGVGKTRLALQIAAELSDLFTDGMFFVALAPLSDPGLVVPTINQALSISDVSGQSPFVLLQSALKDKQLLLILDNFEQVAAAAREVADLLAVCPRLKVLITSRMALHVRAEQEFAVPPLNVPNLKHLPDLVSLTQYEAVALFIARAQAVKPDFQVTNANAPAVAEICARLDGLPLAIELAAAHSKYFPPQTLLARLEHRLTILTGGARDLPVRQQTLRGAIAWSYELLSPEEQKLFRRVAVFVDGCSLEAAEHVCTTASELEGNILEGLASLVDKSLLRQEEQAGGEVRFWMLQTLREFALERLDGEGELETTREAHAAYYLALAEEAEPHLRSAEQAQWFAQLDQEHENLRAALSWLLERARTGGEAGKQQAERALRLCTAVYWFWALRGHLREGRAFLEQALAMREEVVAMVRARALYAAAELAWNQDDMKRAEALCEESLVLFRDLGDKAGIATSLDMLGSIARVRGQYATARTQLEEATALFHELGDTWKRGRCLTELARLATAQGDYSRAYVLLEESLGLYRALGDQERIGWVRFLQAQMLFASQGDLARAEALIEQSLALIREASSWSYALPLGTLGQIRLLQGEPTRARELLEESVAVFKEVGARVETAEALVGLARVAAYQGDLALARHLYEESLALMQEGGYKEFLAPCLEGLAAVVAAQGEPRWAAQLWGTAEAVRKTIGTPTSPVYRNEYEQVVAAVRATLGEETFLAAWAEGRSMTPEQALAAQGQTPLPSSSQARKTATPTGKSPVPYPDELTEREVEVLRLIAQGLTDAQVAEQLIISPRTVHGHLRSIYNKIGVSSRSAATRYAVDHQLV
jgi:predicted ATPase/class 3 adenylate cyclase/DNA-binding CsgD family transcriptional regulator